MRKFLVGAVLIGGATFGLTKALDGLDSQMQTGDGFLSTTTTVAASTPSDSSVAAPEASQAAAPAAAPTVAQPAASRPRATPAAPAPTAPATTAAPRTTTTQAQPSYPATCTLTLSTQNPADGETVTATITSNQPNQRWLSYMHARSGDDRNQGGQLDNAGTITFSFPARTGDDTGENASRPQVMAEVGHGFIDVPEDEVGRCSATYTVV